MSSSDLPNVDSQASSLDDKGDNRTVLMVVMDTNASSVLGMLHDDLEFASLRLNSVVASRVPEEVIVIDDLEEGEWTDKESVEDKDFGSSNWVNSYCKSI